MEQKLIIYSVLSAYLLLKINCSQSWESIVNSSTGNSLSAEYNDSNSEEEEVLNDSNNHKNQEDVEFYSNPHENIEYETQRPRELLKPITVPHNYRNHLNYKHYHKHPSAFGNPYIRSRYQPYSNMPSNNIYNYSPKRPSISTVENDFKKQQPVYANLYWRKIIYPHPQYSSQNYDPNMMIMDNNLGNPKTEESQIINRRYVNPHQKYYYHRNRYPYYKKGNRRNQMTSFLPMPGYPLRNRNYSSRIKPNSIYYKNPALYHRKRRIRPVKHFTNYNNSI